MKASSPIRLQVDLMKAAAVAGKIENRNAVEQVEYWASLGRKIANFVDSTALLEVAAGLAKIKVEPVVGHPINPDGVFTSIETHRLSGDLSQKVTAATTTYQASRNHPGYLEEINESGNRRTGTFQNGVFTPLIEKVKPPK